jgi:hypothetical protein
VTVGRNAVVQATLHIEPTEFFMKRLLISGFVAVALLAVATTLRSHSIMSTERSTVTTGVALSKKSPAAAGVTRLPIEEFEDMSLVFSKPTKP